jgi:hypothetical protein
MFSFGARSSKTCSAKKRGQPCQERSFGWHAEQASRPANVSSEWYSFLLYVFVISLRHESGTADCEEPNIIESPRLL